MTVSWRRGVGFTPAKTWRGQAPPRSGNHCVTTKRKSRAACAGSRVGGQRKRGYMAPEYLRVQTQSRGGSDMPSCFRTRRPHREILRASARAGRVAESCCTRGRSNFENRGYPRDGRTRAERDSADWSRWIRHQHSVTGGANSRPTGSEAAGGGGADGVVEGDVLGRQLKLERFLRMRGGFFDGGAARRGPRRKKGGCWHGEECVGVGMDFNSGVRGSCSRNVVRARGSSRSMTISGSAAASAIRRFRS